MNATLWRQDTSIRVPVRSAAQMHDERSRLFLRVEHDGVAGFGEVAPQPNALNGDASILDVIDEVRVFVLPQVQQILEREGALPSWTRVGRFAGSRAASNPAVALLEMAVLDRELRAANATIEALWPVRVDTPLQTTVSLIDDVTFAVAPSTARVRAKVSDDVLSPAALALLGEIAQRSLPVLLDYNCSARSDDEVIEQVRAIREIVEVAAVEQPYDVGNVVDTARLAERLDVPLSIDEGIRSVRDVAQIVRYHAADHLREARARWRAGQRAHHHPRGPRSRPARLRRGLLRVAVRPSGAPLAGQQLCRRAERRRTGRGGLLDGYSREVDECRATPSV